MGDRNLELALRIRTDMKQAQQALNELENELRGVGQASRTASTGAKTAASGMDAVSVGAKAASTNAGALATSMGKLPNVAGRVNSAFHDLRNILVGAFAVHEIVSFTKSLADANVEAQRIHFTLQQAFGDDAQQQLDFVRNLSDELGLSFQDTATAFGQIAASAQGTGVSARDLQTLFRGLSEAATVLHTPAAELNATFIQLAQGISLGTLQMQDIRAISQHLPGTMTILQDAAKRLGTTLEDALAHGGLDARKALVAIGEVAHERFGVQAKEASHSLNAELNRLHSTLFQLQTDGTGFADTFANAIRDMNQSLTDPQTQQALKSLVTGLGEIANAAIGASAKIGEFLGQVRSYAEFAAKMQHGAGPGDLAASLVEQGNIEAELRQRAAHPTLSAINSFLAGSENNVVQNALEGGRPRIQAMSTAQLQQRLAELQAQILRDRFAPKPPAPNPQQGDERGLFAGLPKGTSPTTPDAAAAKRAQQLAEQAAKAQDDLTQSLIGLQGQLSPTAAIYAKYNATVEKATADAELAKKAKGADAAAIDAQRDAVIGLAGTIRDAALDQLAEKDRQAWEALKRSFETPAQVRVDDAIKQIEQLNEFLKTGVIKAQQYHDALGQIGQKSVAGALPTYQGLDATVGGPYSELQKNYQAQTALDAAFQAQKLALDQKFNDQEEAQHAAHMAALAQLDQDYKTQNTQIERARGQLQLNAASSLFGQLATLSTSHNKKMAAIGKAAAIAQAVIETYKSANEAYSALALIPYVGPVLGAAAAGAAIAAGLANVAQIRSQSTGGYSEGGMTPPGGKYQVAGFVHAGEGVLSQDDISALGGPAAFEAFRKRLHGYADGGFVSPYANAPSPAQLGFAAPSHPRIRMSDFAANDSPGGGDGSTTHIHVWSVEEAAEKMAQLPAFQKAVVHIVGDNPMAIKGNWSR